MNQTLSQKNVFHELPIDSALQVLINDMNTKLIDVRSEEEWISTGVLNFEKSEGRVFFISWRLKPDMKLNGEFLQDVIARVSLNEPVLLLCKSGGRSQEAALMLAAHGFNAYNVLGGFDEILIKNQITYSRLWKIQTYSK